MVLSGLYERRNIAAISAEPSHYWGILKITIPHLYVIWAIYIHDDERDINICSIGLRNEVDTVG